MLDLFTTGHFIWLGISVIIATIVVVTLFLTKAKLNVVLTIAVIVLLALDLVKIGYNVSYSDDPSAPWQKGFYVAQFTLPFHLCALQAYLMLIARCSNGLLRKVLLPVTGICSILGGILAIMIPVEGVAFWDGELLKSIMSTRYFTAHGLLIAFGVRIVADKEIEWSFMSYLRTLACLALLVSGSIYVNAMFHTNFMYTAYPPAENLPILTVVEGDFMSWIAYLGVLVGGVTALITLAYVPGWIVNAVSSKKMHDLEESYEEEYDEEEDDRGPITITGILDSEE